MHSYICTHRTPLEDSLESGIIGSFWGEQLGIRDGRDTHFSLYPLSSQFCKESLYYHFSSDKENIKYNTKNDNKWNVKLLLDDEIAHCF